MVSDSFEIRLKGLFGTGGIPGWSVSAFHESGTGSITALAECARIAP